MVSLKLKKREEGGYRVIIDGKPSPLYIIKGPAPKYRVPQEWDAYHDDSPNWPLVTSNAGLQSVIAKIDKLIKAINSR